MTKRMTTTTAIRDVLERSGAIDDAPRRRRRAPRVIQALTRSPARAHELAETATKGAPWRRRPTT